MRIREYEKKYDYSASPRSHIFSCILVFSYSRILVFSYFWLIRQRIRRLRVRYEQRSPRRSRGLLGPYPPPPPPVIGGYLVYTTNMQQLLVQPQSLIPLHRPLPLHRPVVHLSVLRQIYSIQYLLVHIYIFSVCPSVVTATRVLCWGPALLDPV